MDTKSTINKANINDDATASKLFDRQQYEYERICESLKDGNCDDVIKFLLSDIPIKSKQKKQAQGDADVTLNESVSTLPKHTILSNNTVINSSESDTISKSQSSPSSYSLTDKKFEIPSTSSSSMSCASHSLRSDNSSSSINTGVTNYTRKPPVQPVRSSAIINLDKNRINLRRHRAKLLPRPISLPSSFNLIKNFRAAHGDNLDGLNEEKIDIEFIRQLEEDIYRSKEQVTSSARQKFIPTKLHGNDESCPNCQKRVSSPFAPNQVAEEKTFNDELSKLNDSQKPVLMLDAWQLQPLLMKCDNYEQGIKTIDLHGRDNSTNGDKSILIVDNSEFYPVLMKYELRKNASMPLEREIRKIEETCDCIENSAQMKDFSKLFEKHLNKLTEIKPLDENYSNKGDKRTMQYKNKSNKDFSAHKQKSKSSINLSKRDLRTNATETSSPELIQTGNKAIESNVDSSTKISRPSRFKRFLMQRKILNLSLRSKRSRTKDYPTKMNNGNHDEITKHIPNGYDNHRTDAITTPSSSSSAASSCASPISLHSTLKTNGCKFIPKNNNYKLNGGNYENRIFFRNNSTRSNDDENGSNNSSSSCGLELKNTKLKWILFTKPKVNTFKRRLMVQRYTHSCCIERDMLTTSQTNIASSSMRAINEQFINKNSNPDNYIKNYCQLFRNMSWSCSDLVDISHANYLRTLYLQYEQSCENGREQMHFNEIPLTKSNELTTSAASQKVGKCAETTNVVRNKKSASGMKSVQATALSGKQQIGQNTTGANDDDAGVVLNRRSQVRNIKRRSSFRLKRHSVGSATAMTDVVKTWVYRRRCLFVFILESLFFNPFLLFGFFYCSILLFFLTSKQHNSVLSYSNVTGTNFKMS